MNATLDATLCRDFPLLFAGRHRPMRETAMCWGFECGDGWELLIRKAAEKLEPIIAALKHKDSEAWEQGFYRASQIKEKFGTLRFYLSGGTDEMWTIVQEAEKQSEKTCETCGKAGKLRGDGWYYTACSKCHKKRKTK